MTRFGKLVFDNALAYATEDRIKLEDRSSGFYYYELRADGWFGHVCTIEPSVWVDFAGTLITDVPIKFEDSRDEYRELGENESVYIEEALAAAGYTWNELMITREQDEEYINDI